MTDLWEERKKAIENEYFYNEEKRRLKSRNSRLVKSSSASMVKIAALNAAIKSNP